LVPVQIVR